MILVHLGHVPLDQHHHRGLFEAYARDHLFVYVEKPPRRWLARGGGAGSLSEAFASGVVPERGFVHASIRGPLPLERFGAVTEWNWWLGLRALLRWLRPRTTAPVVLSLQTPCLLPTFRGLGADLRVYQVIDDYVGLAPDPFMAHRVARSHARSLREADVVWAISETLADAVRPLRADVRLTTTGVDHARFAAARGGPPNPEVGRVGSPRIGLVGVLNDRVDWNLLEAIARRRADWHLVLVGPVRHAGPETGPALDRLLRLGNVVRIGEVEEDQLPACIAGFDVCLVAYRTGPGTLGINPLKLYQYLAVGKPVVATPLPVAMEFGDLVRVARTVDQFEAAIAASLLDGEAAAMVAARQRRAHACDWGAIATDRAAILA
ncbi:MAG TPA: glycosyltransferase, partial [Dongiaceae bacterium]|nr:glycosyltransferase [Dongiaceae bacterium]